MAGIMQLAASIIAASGPPAPPGPPPANSIDVATINQNSSDWYGAYNYTSGYVNFSISNFGTIRSDYLYAVMYQTDGFSTIQTNIALNDGSYTGFTVTNGVIDGDLQSYPRVFTIGGSNYTFNLGAQGFYFAYGDPINLASSVGSTITTVYNPAIQPSLTPNTIIVAQYAPNQYNTYYGASKIGPTGFGTVASDYLKEVFYDTSTYISLAPGTYTGFTVDSDGLIDGDNSTARTFTINGIDAVFTVIGSAPNYSYRNMGNPFSLNAEVGNTLTAIYDPAAQPVPGPGEFVSGTMTVGTDSIQYGWRPPMIGSSTISTPPSGPTYQILYGTVSGSPTLATTIIFVGGTYGATVVDGAAATIDGENSITVTIDGITEIGTLVTNTSGPPGCTLTFAGDVFSLQSKNTQTLAVTMVAGAATPGEVASGSITVGTDPFGPPGSIYGYWPGPGVGSSTVDPALLGELYWFAGGGPSGTTSIRITAGTYGSVVVDGSLGTVDGETQLTVVVDSISQTGTLTANGSYVGFTIIGDPYSLQSKNTQTLAVSIIAGAGGGGGTTYTSSGNWSSSSLDNFGFWRVFLNLEGGVNSAFLSSLNALTAGSTFSVTDSGNTTVSVTVQSTMGQPWSPGSSVTINVNTPPPGTSSMPSIASITI